MVLPYSTNSSPALVEILLTKLHVGTHQCRLLIWFKFFHYQSVGDECSCSPNPCQKYHRKFCKINISTHSKLFTKKPKKTVRVFFILFFFSFSPPNILL